MMIGGSADRCAICVTAQGKITVFHTLKDLIKVCFPCMKTELSADRLVTFEVLDDQRDYHIHALDARRYSVVNTEEEVILRLEEYKIYNALEIIERIDLLFSSNKHHAHVTIEGVTISRCR